MGIGRLGGVMGAAGVTGVIEGCVIRGSNVYFHVSVNSPAVLEYKGNGVYSGKVLIESEFGVGSIMVNNGENFGLFGFVGTSVAYKSF